MIRQLRRSISLLLLLFCGYLIVVVVRSMFGLYTNHTEVPLYDVQGIIVKNNVIYIGVGPPANRVQKYTIDGQFIENTQVNGGNKKYTFTVDEYDFIEVKKHSLNDRKMLEKSLGKEEAIEFYGRLNSAQLFHPTSFKDEHHNE